MIDHRTVRKDTNMTAEEVKEAYEELKEKGMEPKDIGVALGKLYENGDITKDQLGALLEPLGYKLKPEFAELDDEEAKKKLWKSEGDEPEEGVTKEEAEYSEDLGSNQAPGSKGDEPEEPNEPKGEGEPKADEDEDEEEERKEAFRYMNIKD